MASDDFTDSSGTGLEAHDANWGSASATYDVASCEIQSDAAQAEGTWNPFGARYTTSSEDFSQIVFVGNGDFTARHVIVRANGTVAGYGLYFSGTSGNNFTSVKWSKDFAWLANGVDGEWDFDTDHTLRIIASGTSTVTCTGYVDDLETPVDTNDDSSSPYEPGSPGFIAGNEPSDPSRTAFDNWTDTVSAGAIEINVSESITCTQGLD